LEGEGRSKRKREGEGTAAREKIAVCGGVVNCS